MKVRHLAAVACLWMFASWCPASPYDPTVGDLQVDIHDDIWRDDKRNRDLPVRIYLPKMEKAEPAPLILVSHGLGGTRAAMAYAAGHWAGRGYVVVALQHPGSDDGVWKNAKIGERMSVAQKAASVENWTLRCGDVSFAIEQLTTLNDKPGLLENRIATDRIGIAGHSFGAQTVQAVLGQRIGTPRVSLPSLADPRIKAAVAFSPGYKGLDAKWAFADFKTPCFHFTGTHDSSAIARDMQPAQRRIPYDNIAADGQYLVTFEGGDHAVFGGGEGRRGGDPEQYNRFHALIQQSTAAFWDDQLRGNADARDWLRDRFPGVLGKEGVFEHRADAGNVPTTQPAKTQ